MEPDKNTADQGTLGVSAVEVSGALDVLAAMFHPPVGIALPVPLVRTLLNVFAPIRLIRGFRFGLHC
jgi:hypothetical protein